MTKRCLQYVTLPCFVLISTFLYCQESSRSFERISVNEGLSQVSVYSIVQDKDGFMWFGTDDGLNRYDGYDVKVYRYDSEDPNPINNNTINALYVDKRENLWVGTNSGLNLFIPSIDGFITYSFDHRDTTSVSGNVIWCISEDHDGNLWIGTNNGLNKFNYEKNNFARYRFELDNDHSLSNNSVNSMFVDRSGSLWLGTNRGINRYNPESDDFERIGAKNKKIEDYSGVDVIQSLAQDRDDNMLVGTNRGLYQLKSDSLIKVNNWYVSNKNINSIHYNADGSMWIGTNDGLVKFEIEQEKWQLHTHNVDKLKSISNNKITTIYEDETGIIWIGTYSGGVNKYYKEQQQFVHFQKNNSDFRKLPSNKVLSLLERDNSDLYIGTDRGLSKLNLNNYKLEEDIMVSTINEQSNTVVTAMTQIPNHSIAIGTSNQGMYFHNRETNEVSQFYRSDEDTIGISGNRISALLYAHNYLWIGTENGGLNRYSFFNKQFSNYTYDPDEGKTLKSSSISCLAQGKDGEIWIGTTNAGIFRLDLATNEFDQFKFEATKEGLSDNYVLSMHYYSGTVWVGTRGGGLDKFEVEENKWTSFTTDNGLPNNVVYCIVQDKNQSLWLTTNKGIAVFNQENNTIISYDEVDGLGNQTFNSQSGILTSKNQLFFGGIQGMDLINYLEIKENKVPPKVVFTELEVFNADSNQYEQNFTTGLLSEVDRFTLKPQHNLINIGFSAISYRQPEKNQYAYRIKGLNNEWIYIGTRHYVTLSNLSPGEYTLEVKAANNEAVWNEVPAEITFVKRPEYYEENWFKVAVAFGILGLAYALYFIRVNRERKYSKMLEEKVVTRTKIIVQERDEKALLLKEIHHRVKNNLQIINSLLRLQSRFVTDKEALWALEESQSRVLSMADIHQKMYKTDKLSEVNISEYFNELGSRLINTYDLKDSITPKIQIMVRNLNLDTLTPLGLIINEIVSNSLKHGFPDHQEGVIRIELDRHTEPNKFRLVIGDNGVGVPDGALFASDMSMGSQLILGLTDQLNGTLTRLPEQGTLYELIFEEINK